MFLCSVPSRGGQHAPLRSCLFVPSWYLASMTGQLPKDLMEDTYPDPVPLHPDDLVSDAPPVPAETSESAPQ
jgi:hypothetical protein